MNRIKIKQATTSTNQHLKRAKQNKSPVETLKLPSINAYRSILKASQNVNESHQNNNKIKTPSQNDNDECSVKYSSSSKTIHNTQKKVGFVDDLNDGQLIEHSQNNQEEQQHIDGNDSEKCSVLQRKNDKHLTNPKDKQDPSSRETSLLTTIHSVPRRQKQALDRSNYARHFNTDTSADYKYRSPETLELMRTLENVFSDVGSVEESALQSKFPDYPGVSKEINCSYAQRFGNGETTATFADSRNSSLDLIQDSKDMNVVRDVNVSHNPTQQSTTTGGSSEDYDWAETVDVGEVPLTKTVSKLSQRRFATSGTSINNVTESVVDNDVTAPSDHDLSNFRFDLLTKPHQEVYTTNQLDYKRYCGFEGIIPNAFILRSLVTNAMILQSQQLGPRSIKALCCALASNHWCVELEISEDDISIKTMTYISDMLVENGFITSIDLGDNQMGRGPVRLLIDALRIVDRIVALSLSGNCLTDADGDVFADYLIETAILKDLDLSYNGFRCEAGTLLGKAIGRNASLECLSLRWNHLHYSGGQGLIRGLEANTSIKFLDLAWNGLGTEGVRGLTRMLRRNATLEELDISANRINMASMLTLLGAIKKNASLRDLHMGENVLSSGDVHTLLETLLTTKGELSVKNLNLGRCTINLRSISLVERMIDERDIMVIHGPVYGEKEKTDSEQLAGLNPVTVLLEFGRLLDMTLEELFNYIDEDGGGTLDRDEIRNGMNAFDIPLPERSLDILIRKMDSDGDGEIALCDLQKADNADEMNRIRDKMKAKCMTVSNPETEKIRCRKILGRLLAENATRREAEAMEAAQEAEKQEAKEAKVEIATRMRDSLASLRSKDSKDIGSLASLKSKDSKDDK